MRWLLLAAVMLPLSGCSSPDLAGDLSVQGNVLYLDISNHGSEDLHLLPVDCRFGVTFRVLDGDDIVASYHSTTTQAGLACTDAPRHIVRPGTGVSVAWTWFDAYPGIFTAQAEYFDWGPSDGDSAQGTGAQKSVPFTIT